MIILHFWLNFKFVNIYNYNIVMINYFYIDINIKMKNNHIFKCILEFHFNF